ncbi:YhcN/YlaJ family sporulation lipoprotein [Thermotalea metallivorans]|uniref:Lipoprotein YhcN n=1 Tax=Thermotalea metallivorans TaxID=520762 RepID=A0A140L6J8_9FIRM|nr:YhcN/YlaJ family sporulation lipoprotein [Thermotalea metallivorans]KXG76173.1 Lipoprotein YhcN [Thermotalea metallivorans]
MRFNKYIFKAVVFFLIFSLLIVGCTPARRPVPSPTPPTTPAPETAPMKPDNTNVPNEDIGSARNIGNDMNRAMETRILREVERIEGVRNAAVLVNNNTAYIGVDLGTNVPDTRVDAIRKEVVQRVTSLEPSLGPIYVSANPDVVGRLRAYGRDIRAGRPISGFIDQIEELFRRPVPRT